MHLTPRDIDKLVLHQAGFVAQKRLARGLRLNYVEAVALIATQLLEFIRDGRAVAELMDEVQVEGTFPDGTKLVTVHHPIVLEQGDYELALYGSCLASPVAKKTIGQSAVKLTGLPGEIMAQEGHITLNEGRETVTLQVANTGDRPIQVGSHYHFLETNRALVFDRKTAYGHRLDIPAGTAIRFEPGESKTVTLVPIAGNRVVRGGNAWVSGPVTEGRDLKGWE